MKLTPIKSVAIHSYHYDQGSKTLTLKWHSGGMHSCEGVTQQEFDRFIASPSKGKHFHKHLKHRDWSRIDS